MYSIGKWILLSSFAAITLYRLFTGLQTAPIQRWDEQTNISVVQETITLQSFPILFFSDRPFFEKPPLWYYIHVGLFSQRLVSIVPMRIMSALCGLGIILLSVLLAKKWWGNIAGYGTWIVLLTTNHLFITNPDQLFSTHTFKSADLDSLHILFLLMSFICSLYINHSKTLALSTGVFAGLSVLTKSPLGLLPLLVVQLTSIIHSKKHVSQIRLAWISLLGIILPWYVFMYILYGSEFISTNMFYHIQTRTMVAIEGHNNPWWFYGYILLKPHVFFISWLFPLLFFWQLFRKNISKDKLLLNSYILCILFLFIPTIMQTRLAWYILPFYPFAALIVGKSLQDIYNTVTKRKTL